MSLRSVLDMSLEWRSPTRAYIAFVVVCVFLQLAHASALLTHMTHSVCEGAHDEVGLVARELDASIDEAVAMGQSAEFGINRYSRRWGGVLVSARIYAHAHDAVPLVAVEHPPPPPEVPVLPHFIEREDGSVLVIEAAPIASHHSCMRRRAILATQMIIIFFGLLIGWLVVSRAAERERLLTDASRRLARDAHREMLEVVNHQLRNPLSAAVGQSELLGLRLDGEEQALAHRELTEALDELSDVADALPTLESSSHDR